MRARIRIGGEIAGAVISLLDMVYDVVMGRAVSPLMAFLFLGFIVALVWEFTGRRSLVSRRVRIMGFVFLFLLTLVGSLWYKIGSVAGLP
jgi:hypothetical protein